MRMAFTLDDLPVFPHLALPDGHTPRSVASRIMKALDRNGVSGVFALANSWALDTDPETARILDDWVAAGHHVGNHTHSHPLLNDISAEEFNHDVSVADELLAPWIDKAPLRVFRHPLEFWGDTEEKRVAVNAHLNALAYHCAGVTSWFYEWEWDRAWRCLLQTGRADEAEALKAEFVDYVAAQVAHDAETCRTVFGHDVVAIGLIHPVAFFTEVADKFFATLLAEGVTFVPLAEALQDPAYGRSGTFVSDAFLVYQNKVALADGRELDAVPATHKACLDRVFDLATPLRPPRRGMLVRNMRPWPNVRDR
jgi:peptidoglycan/xylan/chitin deacetylase (PgdA/CDA1 family)